MVAILAGAAVCAAATATPEGCRALRLHGKKAEATACFEALTRSGDAYRMAEGYWGLRQWDQSKAAFETAVGQAKSPALWHVRYGMLFHERFNNVEAVKLFDEALEQDPGNAQAYLGLAMVSADGFDEKAPDYAAKAVAADPKLVEAHEFMAGGGPGGGKAGGGGEGAGGAVAVSP